MTQRAKRQRGPVRHGERAERPDAKQAADAARNATPPAPPEMDTAVSESKSNASH